MEDRPGGYGRIGGTVISLAKEAARSLAKQIVWITTLLRKIMMGYESCLMPVGVYRDPFEGGDEIGEKQTLLLDFNPSKAI